MRKLMMTSLIAISLLMLPAMASATWFTGFGGAGDCEGFIAEAGIFFCSNAPTLEIAYTVTLSDMDGLVLETISETVIVENEGISNIVLNFSDSWTVEASGGFIVHGVFELTSAYPGGIDHSIREFSNELSCTVATEDISFGSVKSMYR